MSDQFDHEKLDVYRCSLEFVAWVTPIIEKVQREKRQRTGDTLSQLDRASTSIVLSIAEGNGRRGSKQRARFFDDARGSATEAAACLDVLVAKQSTSTEQIAEGKRLLIRIVSMLSKLVQRFESD